MINPHPCRRPKIDFPKNTHFGDRLYRRFNLNGVGAARVQLAVGGDHERVRDNVRLLQSTVETLGSVFDRRSLELDSERIQPMLNRKKAQKLQARSAFLRRLNSGNPSSAAWA
jgi:hypothetical protein